MISEREVDHHRLGNFNIWQAIGWGQLDRHYQELYKMMGSHPSWVEQFLPSSLHLLSFLHFCSLLHAVAVNYL